MLLEGLGVGHLCLEKEDGDGFRLFDLVVTNKTTLTATPLSACVILFNFLSFFFFRINGSSLHLCFSCLHLPAESAVHKKYSLDTGVKGLIMYNL